jgi:disulfide bond formation protein DsbB
LEAPLAGAALRAQIGAMTRARLLPLLLLIASTAVVGAALLSQYVGGLQPCELCLYQRWPYYAVIPLALVALLIGRPAPTRAALALAAVAFLAGAGLAFYHVGVERHWFAGPGACTELAGPADSLAAFKARLLAQQPVSCDKPQWTFFGVTLAGLNLLVSLVLAGFCLAGLGRPLARRRFA